MFAAGDYAPPEGLSRYVVPPPGRAVTAHYVQGCGHTAKLTLYKRTTIQISAFVDGVPGGRGYQQHTMDILFSSHPFARAWINIPARTIPEATGAPPTGRATA